MRIIHFKKITTIKRMNVQYEAARLLLLLLLIACDALLPADAAFVMYDNFFKKIQFANKLRERDE